MLQMDLICEDLMRGNHFSIDVSVATPTKNQRKPIMHKGTLDTWQQPIIHRKRNTYVHLVENTKQWNTEFRVFLMSTQGGVAKKSEGILNSLTYSNERHPSGITMSEYYVTLLNVSVVKRVNKIAQRMVRDSTIQLDAAIPAFQ
eukprot:m.349891 g.349891  ORF g.349891 m.349891 type:complete len:144 (-) comp16155_c1_seq6:370-801(-)